MNITKTSLEPEFEPYSLSIEVKSKEDEAALQALFGLDHTVPEFLANEHGLNADARDRLRRLFLIIYPLMG